MIVLLYYVVQRVDKTRSGKCALKKIFAHFCRRVNRVFGQISSYTSMMRSRAVAANGIVPGSGAEFNAVGLAAAHTARQLSAVGRHVPETLASIALEYVVLLLLLLLLVVVLLLLRRRRWRLLLMLTGDELDNLVAHLVESSEGTLGSTAVAPPALGNSVKAGAEEVQALAQQVLVLACV